MAIKALFAKPRMGWVSIMSARGKIVLLLLSAAAFAGTPEERAISYLAGEVPRWASENHCYSCHNNGDGARALYAALRRGYAVPASALKDTTAWLVRPAEWDSNHGNPLASDKKLARIQFAAALAEAGTDRRALIQAGDSLVPYQEKDGSWQADSGAALGSPVTYGPVLATYMVRRILAAADGTRYRAAIARADAWLRDMRVDTVPDAAALLMAMQKPECLDLIRRTQSSDGGWGPRPHAPPEVFDTALVLLALRGSGEMAERGRAFLIRAQLPSGGWPETTRPPGGQSYAQHISTSAWATLALLASHAER
jgi:hypothetical protein